MTDVVAKTILLLSPVFFLRGVSLVKTDILFFQMAMMSLLFSMLIQEKKRDVRLPLLACLFVLGAFNVVMQKFLLYSAASFFNLTLGIMGVYAIANYGKDFLSYRPFIVAAVAINILVFVAQRYGWNPILDDGLMKGEEGGIMGNAARLSTYLALALPFLPWAGIVLCGLIGLILHETGLLVAVFILAIMHTKGKRRLAVIAAGAVALVVMWDTIWNVSIANRLPVWKATIGMTLQNPWYGFGLGVQPIISSEFHNIENMKVDYVFSSYLQFIFSVGVAGAAWCFFALRELRKRFDHTQEAYALLILAVLSVFKYPMEVHRIWITGVVIAGVFLARTQINGGKYARNL